MRLLQVLAALAFLGGDAAVDVTVNTTACVIIGGGEIASCLGAGDEHADDEHADNEHADNEHADDEHADEGVRVEAGRATMII